MVSKGLRNWFKLHFVIDMVFALPLLFAPAWTLTLLGLDVTGTLTARLVGAALIGIGGASLWMHKGSKAQFLTMLELKLLWSGSAMVALLLALAGGAPLHSTGAIFLIFLIFFFVWLHYFKKLK